MTRKFGLMFVGITALAFTLAAVSDAEARRWFGGGGSWGGNGSHGGWASNGGGGSHGGFGGRFAHRRGHGSCGSHGGWGGYNGHGSHGGAYHNGHRNGAVYHEGDVYYGEPANGRRDVRERARNGREARIRGEATYNDRLERREAQFRGEQRTLDEGRPMPAPETEQPRDAEIRSDREADRELPRDEELDRADFENETGT